MRPEADRARAIPEAAATDVRSRLEALCAGCGPVAPDAVLSALEALQLREADRIDALGAQGIEPWAAFRVRGDAAEMGTEHEWLVSNRQWLLR